MSRFWEHFIANGPEWQSEPVPPSSKPPDDEALDAFSRVVVKVAETLRPAVVNLRGQRGRNEGSGSGILFTPDGFLLTNHHVVGRSEHVRVRLVEGGELDGRVVGADPWTDLAVVQASASGLPSRLTSCTGNGTRAIHCSRSTPAGTSRRAPSNGRHRHGATPMLFTPQMRRHTICSCLRVSMQAPTMDAA